jgi:hypothetical protein
MDDAVMRIWWLSFASADGPLGVVVVDAPTFTAAYAQVNVLRLNPGGKCKAAGILPADLEPDEREIAARLPRLTLLSPQQLEDLGCALVIGNPTAGED